MTALRFQTGRRHQTSPASLRGERETDRQTDRETERERQRETETETQREIGTERERERERERHRDTETQRETETGRERHRERRKIASDRSTACMKWRHDLKKMKLNELGWYTLVM